MKAASQVTTNCQWVAFERLTKTRSLVVGAASTKRTRAGRERLPCA